MSIHHFSNGVFYTKKIFPWRFIRVIKVLAVSIYVGNEEVALQIRRNSALIVKKNILEGRVLDFYVKVTILKL